MPIPLSCKCGGRFKVNDGLAGKRVKCPKCGTLLVIPQSQMLQPQAVATKQDPQDVLGLGNLSDIERSAPATPQAPLGPAAQPASPTLGKQKPPAAKGKFPLFWVLVLGLGVGGLILAGVLAVVFLMPAKQKPSTPPSSSAAGQKPVETVWVVLSNVQQQSGTNFSADWRVAHGPIDANAQYYWIVESASPLSPEAKYLEFPVDLNQQRGRLEGTSQEALELEPDGFYASYVASKSGSDFARVSGVLKLGQAPNETSAKSPLELEPTAARMDVVLTQPRVTKGTTGNLLLVDFEILRPVEAVGGFFLVVAPREGEKAQFEATSSLRERAGTLTCHPVNQDLLTRRPLQIYLETRGGDPHDDARVTVSNELKLN